MNGKAAMLGTGLGFSRWWSRLAGLCALRPARRSLELCETLSLGDRRFVALVRCGEERFLLGATGSSIALLTRLPSEEGREGGGQP